MGLVRRDVTEGEWLRVGSAKSHEIGNQGCL